MNYEGEKISQGVMIINLFFHFGSKEAKGRNARPEEMSTDL